LAAKDKKKKSSPEGRTTMGVVLCCRYPACKRQEEEQPRGPHHNGSSLVVQVSCLQKRKRMPSLDIKELIDSCETPLKLGSCALEDPLIASIVQDALMHFEGRRYHLSAWCIMPNHVHVIVSPIDKWCLSKILYSWKSFTAKESNRLLGRTGTFWERESFDHLIRTTDHWQAFAQYIAQNPVEAGLCSRPEDWPFSHCGAGFQPAEALQFVVPDETEFAFAKTRGELPHLHKDGGTYFVTFRLADAIVYNRKKAAQRAAPQYE